MEKIYAYLPGATYGLEGKNEDAIYKLNTVSETINEISRNYKDEINKDEEGKKAFIKNLKERLSVVEENILYDDLVDDTNGILEDVFNILEKNDYITKEDIINILEKRNEYITGFDDFDTNMKVEDDINKVIRLMNDTYKIGKINNLWRQKMKESKKVISSQLAGVSRAISDVAKTFKQNKDDFEEEKREIKILCGQKDISILDINVEQSDNR